MNSTLKVAHLAALLTLLLNLAACTTLNTPVASTYSSDVVNIREEHLSPDYWINLTQKNYELLRSREEINQMNQNAFEQDKNLFDLMQFPSNLSQDALNKKILKVSKPASSKRVYEDNRVVSSEDYARYHDALNLGSINSNNEVTYGLVVNRTDMRTFPTSDRIFKSVPSDLDRFQETALFPADMVLVLHESTDKKWLFTQFYNYAAWVKKADIAIGDKDVIFNYKKSDAFLVVTGDKVSTNYNPSVAAISELQIDMGTRLPLTKNRPDNVHGQNPYTSYAVQIPLRTDSGELALETALIARSRDVSIGTLPYTKSTIIRQAFKFLGERYGWGHSYNGRDCSGFTAEVYKTVGIKLPRNSGQQARSPMGGTISFNKNSTEAERLTAVAQLDVGDLIFIPGHVMMFIGQSNGEPYVIHDVTGLNYYDENGEFYSGILNGVSVTPLLPLHTSRENRYLDSIYSIKKFN